MFIRVIGSRAPKGSSMRMIRGRRISVWAMATRCRMPPESSCGYLSWSLLDAQADVADPLPRQLVAELARARPGIPGRRRRCPARCGGRSWCSPERPCPGPARAVRPAGRRPARRRTWAGAGAAGRRSAAGSCSCRSRWARGCRRTRPCRSRSWTTNVTSRMAVNSFGPPGLYVLVTSRNSTTCGSDASSGSPDVVEHLAHADVRWPDAGVARPRQHWRDRRRMGS